MPAQVLSRLRRVAVIVITVDLIQCNVVLQEYEGQGAQLKHEAAVIQFDEMELEGYGPFR